MANRAMFRDRRKNPWGKFSARFHWEGGGQDNVWVNEAGEAEFNGSGVIKSVDAAGESIAIMQRVDGNTSFAVISGRNH